jgi:hypothetical protein
MSLDFKKYYWRGVLKSCSNCGFNQGFFTKRCVKHYIAAYPITECKFNDWIPNQKLYDSLVEKDLDCIELAEQIIKDYHVEADDYGIPRCCYCGGTVEVDVPEEEYEKHIEHNYDCPFVLANNVLGNV